jgi:uncharacterized protein (TIRG00374 family)
MRKKFLSVFIRILITFCLVLFVCMKAELLTNLGWQKLYGLFTHIKIEYLLASIGIGFLINLSSSIKWYMLLHSQKVAVGLWRLYAYYSIGKFFNLVLPTSMGGDVVRMYQLSRYTGQKNTAVASVFVERFTGVVTLVIIAIIAVVINLKIFNEVWLTVGLAIGAGILGIIIWFILDKRPLSFISQLFGNKVAILGKIFTKIGKIRKAVLEYKNDKKALLWALINSLIFQFLAVVNVWVSALAFGSEISFVSMLVAVPVILFIMNLPFSIGGIGLMEFAYTFTLALFGASASLALSTALLIRAKSLLDAFIGGILYTSVSSSSRIRVDLAKESNK